LPLGDRPEAMGEDDLDAQPILDQFRRQTPVNLVP
tara:strand:- start:544 stop:648 length:105 start_codon:yes stop_codon:yes gene_type:complete